MSRTRRLGYVASLIALVAAGVMAGCQHPSEPTDSPAPPALAGWPNEPSGLRLVSEWSMDNEPPLTGDVAIPGGQGWRIVAAGARNSARGWVQVGADASGPLSPPGVYDFVYPEGMVEGEAPATVYYDHLNARAIYVGFWWKSSSPFDRGPSGNKVAFMFNGGGDTGGQTFMTFHPDGRLHVLPEYRGDYRWREPLRGAAAVAPGAWHLIEWYADLADGTLKWWVDGALHGSHQDVFNRFAFDMFQFSPTWGGNTGARKRQTDHFWFDHVRLSIR